MPSIEELKMYLGIDGSHNDSLLADFLNTARDIVEKLLRYQIAVLNPIPASVKDALKHAVGYLYANRENADIPQLEKWLVALIEPLRKKEF